jgi:hypothetical protein
MSQAMHRAHLVPTLPARLAALLVAAAAGCSSEPGKGALKNAGEPCLECHRPGGKAAEFLHAAGGTVYARRDAARDAGIGGVEVTLRDASGRTATMMANAAGNFWWDRELRFPVSAAVRRRVEGDGGAGSPPVASPGPTCSSGDCNRCHAVPPAGGARGRIALGP